MCHTHSHLVREGTFFVHTRAPRVQVRLCCKRASGLSVTQRAEAVLRRTVRFIISSVWDRTGLSLEICAVIYSERVCGGAYL